MLINRIYHEITESNNIVDILESIIRYEDINLDNINMLINRIYHEITESNNIVDIADIVIIIKFILKILLIFYRILEMARLMILIKKVKMLK